MPLNKKQRERLFALCGQLNEDDAVDPREFFRQRYRCNDSKALRLCSQVADTLSLVLSGEFADETLHSLEVFTVQPAPNARRLLVIVRPHADIADSVTPEEILAKLESINGVLRTEIAQAISRRKAPSLMYQVLWPSTA